MMISFGRILSESKVPKYFPSLNTDIICLQELLYDKEDFLQFTDQLGHKFNCPYSFYRNYYPNKKNKIDALVILTKYPMMNTGNFEYLEKTIGIYCDILINSDTVRLYNSCNGSYCQR